MKKSLLILICVAMLPSIYAQDKESGAATTSPNEMKTVFVPDAANGSMPFGYFVELNGGYSNVGKTAVFVPGFRMGIILHQHWTFGFTVNGFSDFSNSHHHKYSNYDYDSAYHSTSRLSGGYGGLLVEYTVMPRSRVHLSFPLIIGVGNVSRTYYNRDYDTSYYRPYGYRRYPTYRDRFFVVEPGIKLELNLVKHLRLGLGLSYRYSPDMERRDYSPDMLNQLTGRISIAFGKF
jgi:hypothetical protein